MSALCDTGWIMEYVGGEARLGGTGPLLNVEYAADDATLHKQLRWQLLPCTCCTACALPAAAPGA